LQLQLQLITIAGFSGLFSVFDDLRLQVRVQKITMAQKSRDAATMPRESNNEVQQQQQHRRHFPPEIETRTSSGRRPEDDGRDNKIVNGSRPLPGANKPMTVTAAKTSAANHDHEASPRSAQLRVVINRFGLLELDLSDRNLRSIPDAVFALSRLEVLRLSRNRLRSMPNTVSGLRHLRHLDVGNNEMDELPVALAACSRLVELDVRSNKLTSIPATLPSGLSRHLRALRLAGNRIDQLPDDFGRLGALRLVDLSCNRLRDLPPSFGDLRELNVLILSDNGFDRLPVGVCRLTNLETLDLNKNQLSDLPDNFDRLRRLRELRLAANRFDSIPDSVARTYGLIVLDVSDNAVTSLPAGLATMPRLVELDARRNAIDRFPEVNTGWPCLERLNVSGNRLRTLPVGAMTRLRRLDADRNWLTDVPHGIHRLASTLELLSLAGNRITHLSADLALLKRLRVLDVSDNALRSIPKAVEQMPGLETFDVTGNDLEPRDAVGGPRGGRVLNGHPVAYVVDGLSGPPPPGAVPLVFTQTPSGLLYATPAAAVPLIGHMNGRTAAVRRPVAGAASGAPHASGLVTSRNKSSGGSGVLGLFRKKKNGGGNGHDSGGSVGNSSDKRLGLNAGTQTARDVDAGGHFQFPTASSDMMSPSTFSGANGSSGGVAVGANRPPPSFGGHRPDWNGWPSTVNGRGLDSVSREAIHSTARSMSIGDLHELESFATVGTVAERTATSERRLKQPRWKSTMDVTKSYGDDHPSAFRSPVADHRRRSVSGDSDGDDGRFSDTVTVNDEVGDRLSLGEDDFEFLPPNVHDAKLMRIADDLETMLNEQLLDPIIDGHQANGLSSGQHRAANQPAVGVGLRPVLQTTTSRVNGTRGNSSNM
jgi:Leucine-rich repeat (LRR) protein